MKTFNKLKKGDEVYYLEDCNIICGFVTKRYKNDLQVQWEDGLKSIFEINDFYKDKNAIGIMSTDISLAKQMLSKYIYKQNVDKRLYDKV